MMTQAAKDRATTAMRSMKASQKTGPLAVRSSSQEPLTCRIENTRPRRLQPCLHQEQDVLPNHGKRPEDP